MAVHLFCPSCGKRLSVECDKETATCMHCGAPFPTDMARKCDDKSDQEQQNTTKKGLIHKLINYKKRNTQ